MRWGIGYPLEAIGEAVRSSVRWGMVIFAIMFVGAWLGVWIAGRQCPSVTAGFSPLGVVKPKTPKAPRGAERSAR
jgi:hypothetical protein